jgi:hypothetical protein
MAAVACALAYAIARQLGAGRWTAVCAAIGLATGASFWRSAVFAEVYSLAAVVAGLVIALLLAWGARGRARWLVAAFGAFAIGLGNHLTIVGVVPAFATYALTRRHRIWSIRVVAACALLLALGVGQYALIVVRTRQQAPYVEVRASTAKDLIDVVTAERFAGQRFAFGPSVLLTGHLPALSGLIAREFGAAGTIFFLIGALGAFRSANAALVLGAAAGMFAMVLNISGDLRGFITPLMVLVWPIAATGVEAVAQYARSIRGAGSAPAALVLASAAVMPLANIAANYAEADQSRHTGDGQFLRSVLRQVPDGAALVAEDYWSDMAWRYYSLTGEAGPDRGIGRLDFSAERVRDASREGHRVFALATGATFLAAEGLTFRRAAIEGPPLADWLASLPRGSLVVGAMAYAPLLADLSPIGHPHVRPPGRDRSFEVFALTVRAAGHAWRRGDEAVSLTVDAQSLGARVPALAGGLVATSGNGGARIDFAGRPVARIESGLALSAFAPDGTLVRALEFAPGQAQRVDYEGALYEFARESRCAELTPGAWADLTPVLANGSWVATMYGPGSIVIETVTPGSRDVRARSALLLGDGTIETAVAHHPDGDVLTTTLTRGGDRRPLFRLALDRPILAARARVLGTGTPSAIRVCALNAVQPLFAAGQKSAVLKPDFESEAYFGAGWSDAMRTPTGPARRAENGAALFLPLERGHEYRLLLDLDLAETLSTGSGQAPSTGSGQAPSTGSGQAPSTGSGQAVELDVALNGVRVGGCNPQPPRACELRLPSAGIQDGVNTLTLSSRRGHGPGSAAITLFAARISQGP